MKKVLLVSILQVLLNSVISQETYYTAAVVEYSSPYYANWQVETVEELFSKNVEEYTSNIERAAKKGAQIIVFPEYGLTNIYPIVFREFRRNDTKIEEYAFFLPEISDCISPCLQQMNYTFAAPVIRLSCDAHRNGLYVVINLLEKVYDHYSCDYQIYNTNVVFDRKGTIIAKYRKIHLSEEPFLNPGTDLVTFRTDFGVTFGIFICYDILFKYPALDLLFSDPYVTDIIFTSAWFTETPFLTAPTIEHGYAKANGINLLAAGLKETKNQNGGSGIFLADGSVGKIYISGNDERSKLLIHDVTINKQRTPFNFCQDEWIPIDEQQIDEPKEDLEIGRFPSSPQDLSNYTFKSLSKGPLTLEVICSSDFCCSFTIDMEEVSFYESNATYKLIAYQGLERYGSDLLGVRVCGLIFCLNRTDLSCGSRPKSDIILPVFRKIVIAAISIKTSEMYDQPASLKSDLTPVERYVYCETELDEDKVEITLRTEGPQRALLNFGIFGRIYDLQTPKIDTTPVHYSLTIMMISSIFVLIICIVTFFINHCKSANRK